MMRSILWMLALTAAGYVLLCLYLYAVQRSAMYFPVPESSLPGAEATWLDVDGARLKLWVVDRPGPRALLYLGGNADDVAGSVPGLAATFPGHAVYAVNYRGYGGSSGTPTESALVADALRVFDHVRERHAEIDVIGRSLGAGVAMALASERGPRRLVLVTPADSMASVARAHYPMFPVGLLMRDRYDAASRAPAVRAPVLVVVAGRDEIIPRSSTEALVDAFPPGQVRLAEVPGADHNHPDLAPDRNDAVRRFLLED